MGLGRYFVVWGTNGERVLTCAVFKKREGVFLKGRGGIVTDPVIF